MSSSAKPSLWGTVTVQVSPPAELSVTRLVVLQGTVIVVLQGTEVGESTPNDSQVPSVTNSSPTRVDKREVHRSGPGHPFCDNTQM